MPPLKPTDPPIIATACQCGWEYPRNFNIGRARIRGRDTALPGVTSDELAEILNREPLVVFFICPCCSAEIFATIQAQKPRVLPTG